MPPFPLQTHGDRGAANGIAAAIQQFTTTAGVIGAPAGAFVGCWIKLIWLAPLATFVSAKLALPETPDAVAVTT